jgi:ubiquinone/menaquinone biosynthesis C-methylase UbiE
VKGSFRDSADIPQKGEKTSWGKEAKWYSDHLESPDTYHAKVILPNLMRIVAPEPRTHILEIGCGEGFFSRAFAEAGASVTASDVGKELITVAKEKGGGPEYHVSPAEDLSWVRMRSMDTVVAVLTLQNMEHIEPVMKEVAKTLRPGGRFVFVLNHPAFRIPKATAWGYDEGTKTQYRRVDAYLSARKEKVDMHPGAKQSKSYTYSFHRSLQDYMKALRAAGFSITRLEEWISHKTSEPGPKARAENIARKEFPLFMLIEAQVVH